MLVGALALALLASAPKAEGHAPKALLQVAADPLGDATALVPDGRGNVQPATDALARVTGYTSTPRGYRDTETDAAGLITDRATDSNGNVAACKKTTSASGRRRRLGRGVLMHLDQSPELFEKVEAPMRRLDPTLDDIAAQLGVSVERNRKDSPRRHLITQGADGLFRQLGISPVTDVESAPWTAGTYHYSMYLIAWKDVRGRRSWWHRPHANCGDLSMPEAEFRSLVLDGWAALERVTESDLKLAPAWP